ncbi:hypothetical protein [Streptomyces nitrosporeus]|uniref:hypothetical protein n=1 Tax=Streptomyces nitrosporeus TaxID=28894 RepID=UPI0019AFF3A9|nr:hypothetical protein [Streptomyces nitrosporeus]GGZ09459.1 hypothetical protein GCM10010327_44940 [Streptomyces nitrosporeus]
MNDVTTPEPGKDREPAGTGTDAPAAAPAGTDTPAAVPAPAGRPGKAGRIVLTVLPFVLVLGAVGGAGAYTVSAVDGADRTAKTRVWQEGGKAPGRDPAGDVGAGRHDTELSRLLLPVPDGYALGPDADAEGNDSEASGKKATAAMKESGRGLAGKERRAFDNAIEKLEIKGVAVRTYSAVSADLVVRTTITKMLDREAVRGTYAFRKELMEAMGSFRKGPSVKGHKHAACFLMPVEKDAEGGTVDLGGMECVAYDGELSISLSASGTRPFDKGGVADLLKDQMDHIASPGEYV